MTPINFTFHDTEFTGNCLPSDKGKGWYKVLFFDHSAVILHAGIKTKEGKNIWVQSVQPGEAIWPHELIQKLGEAIEAAPVDK